jgi:hypothetical protein
MRELHAGRLPALSGVEFERGLPAPAARVVRLGRRRRASTALSTLLTLVVGTAGRFRLWPAQLGAARLLRRLEQQRGALEQAQRS